MLSTEKGRETVKKVLDVLSEDARLSYAEIARKTGLHKNTIANVIKQLEQDKVILGYRPVVDYEKLGMHSYFLLVKSKKMLTDKVIKEIYQKGTQITYDFDKEGHCQVLHSGFLHGFFDVYICFVANDLKIARTCVHDMVKNFDEYIDTYELMEELLMVRRCGHLNKGLFD